jgi:hypothetical protein
MIRVFQQGSELVHLSDDFLAEPDLMLERPKNITKGDVLSLKFLRDLRQSGM